jgi:transketolase C-terminal domain/subunit
VAPASTWETDREEENTMTYGAGVTVLLKDGSKQVVTATGASVTEALENLENACAGINVERALISTLRYGKENLR